MMPTYKPKEYTEDETWSYTIVTDQGNGSSMCGKCRQNLDSNIYFATCPRCHRKVVNSDDTWINYGGSDF